MCISSASVLLWDGEVRRRKTKAIWTPCIASRCLGTPARPCAYCKEQVLCWTQEMEERQREGRRRRWAAALTDPQSPETATAWNRRLWDDPLLTYTHTADTPKKHWRTYSVSPAALLHLFKSAGRHAHTLVQCITPAERTQGLCLFGTSLSLSGNITQSLHNAPYHFLPIHLSLSLSFDFQ